MLRMAGVFIALMAFVALIPSPADGCAIAPQKGRTLQTASEEALIVFDEQTKTEHFIRTASFSGDSSDFGFLVPTPGRPEISEVDLNGVLATFSDVTRPRIVKQKKYVGGFALGCMLPMASNDGTLMNLAEDMAPRSAVNVVDRKRVGNLDAAVLQAEKPEAVREWLVKNGYNDRPELTEWLKAYTDGTWYITAYKIASDAVASGPRSTIRSTTVKMSFPTPTAFYPYREPSDARSARANGRVLKLHLLASRISAGTIGLNDSKPWPARTTWAGLLPPDAAPSVFESLRIGTRPNEAWYLTEFVDESNPRPGTDELFFGMASDQSPVERPPIVEYELIDTTIRDTLSGLGLGVIVLAMVIYLTVKLAGLARKRVG
jgi:hypothetical protein